MSVTYLKAIALAATILIVVSSSNIARGQRPLKVLEQYSLNTAEYQANPKTATRRIEYLYFYDAANKIVERWDFLGNYYRRHVFSRDRRGRTSADLIYESTRLGENEWFKVERSSTGVRVVPTVSDKLLEIKLSKYNDRDQDIEEQTTDGDGILKERVTRDFDRYGNMTLYRRTNAKGTLIGQETQRRCSSDGRRCESSSRQMDGTIVKNITSNDEKYRIILDEVFRYPLSVQGKPLLTGRSVRSYIGDRLDLDWFIFRDDGTPTQRLMIVSKGDREISRKTFSASISDDGAVKWLPDTEELRECTFDKGGECITEIWKERKSGETTFKLNLIHERVVSWY